MATSTEPNDSAGSTSMPEPTSAAAAAPSVDPTATTTTTTTTTPTNTPTTTTTTDISTKEIHSLILDAGPLIKNDPPVSTLLARACALYTTPRVLETELRDPATRARVETTLRPFLTVRDPRPDSLRVVRDFARRTGDLDVLSAPDLALLALAYELECERNGGDWRLRRTPGQKGLNGKAPGKGEGEGEGKEKVDESEPVAEKDVADGLDSLTLKEDPPSTQGTVSEETTNTTTSTATEEAPQSENKPQEAAVVEGQAEEDDSDSDSEGWITPSNLKKQQEKDGVAPSGQKPAGQRFLQVALLTSDYAMQNVLLRMNLNLVSPSLARITRVKTWALRCHGCFLVLTRDGHGGNGDMARQFCPRCGQPTLTRVSVSTDQATGAFTVHLKKNFQWNNRGNVYSVPKPVHGSANGRATAGGGGGGGGKNGWGRDLIVAEDQKEYLRKRDEQRKREKSARDLMDDDYLPAILSGDRKGGGPGRIKVGAGRNVNSRKRR